MSVFSVASRQTSPVSGVFSPDLSQRALDHSSLATPQLREAAVPGKIHWDISGTCCTKADETKAKDVWAQVRSCITKVYHLHTHLHIFPHKKIRLEHNLNFNLVASSPISQRAISQDQELMIGGQKAEVLINF